jgi:hypothetical protein
MLVQPDGPKLVTIFRDRPVKGSQTAVDRHLGDRRDLVRRALIMSGLGEAGPESDVAMAPANRGMKALPAVELNVGVQNWAIDGSKSSPARDAPGQLVEGTEPFSVLGSMFVTPAHVGSDWDEVQAADAQLDHALAKIPRRIVAKNEDEPFKNGCHMSSVAARSEHSLNLRTVSGRCGRSRSSCVASCVAPRAHLFAAGVSLRVAGLLCRRYGTRPVAGGSACPRRPLLTSTNHRRPS